MQWVDALRDVVVLEQSDTDAQIHGVEYDSRRVAPGSAFVAMRGATTDGNRYVDTAIQQGATAILTDSQETYATLLQKSLKIPTARVEHGRRGLAELSAAFFGHPERKLKISAVTGTNGKTTTAYLLDQLLRSAGRTTVLLGTIETHVGDEVRASAHTTPESRDILEVFADGVRAGATEAVMEMSSHALDQERVWGLPVDVAIFTNLTQDHLDYHGTMEKYLAAKAKLFEGVGAPHPRIAIVNADDPRGDRIEHLALKAGCQVWKYGWETADGWGPEYRPENIEMHAGETTFLWRTSWGPMTIKSPLTGRVNVYNLVAASCAALARGLTLDEVATGASKLRQVPGRFQVVPGSEAAGFTVVVDYAHTDDALRNLIALARELAGAHGGRVITLFGCGGDRDRSKRPKMGRAAGEGSDLVVLTSDNPRSEDPRSIIEEALVGVRQTQTQCIVEPDRSAAIGIAIRAAHAGDIVLIAGKGHEKVQILRDTTIPFDDVAVAAGVLREI